MLKANLIALCLIALTSTAALAQSSPPTIRQMLESGSISGEAALARLRSYCRIPAGQTQFDVAVDGSNKLWFNSRHNAGIANQVMVHAKRRVVGTTAYNFAKLPDRTQMEHLSGFEDARQRERTRGGYPCLVSVEIKRVSKIAELGNMVGYDVYYEARYIDWNFVETPFTNNIEVSLLK